MYMCTPRAMYSPFCLVGPPRPRRYCRAISRESSCEAALISFRILVVAAPTFGLLLYFNPGLVLLQDSGYSASYCFILPAAAAGGSRGSTSNWDSMGRRCCQI